MDRIFLQNSDKKVVHPSFEVRSTRMNIELAWNQGNIVISYSAEYRNALHYDNTKFIDDSIINKRLNWHFGFR